MNIKTPDFNLETTLGSGQVFGFSKKVDGAFEGSLAGRRIILRQKGDILETNPDIPEADVRSFFHLDYDLAPIYRLLAGDEPLRKTAVALKGLRIICQEPWEALAGFILSSNNNIKRIQGIWGRLLREFSNGSIHFPHASEIAASTESVLRKIGLGYRAPFLLKTAQMVSSEPNHFDRIRAADYAQAKSELIRYPGVGEKIADCVLLFGFQKYEAFPVDVWILRVMRKLYFRNRKISEKKVQMFAQKRWGRHAGYIQQYLYHGARTGII